MLLWCSECQKSLAIADPKGAEDLVRRARKQGWTDTPHGWRCAEHEDERRDDEQDQHWFDREPA